MAAYISIITALVGALGGAMAAGFAAYFSARAAFRNVRATNVAQATFKKAEFRQAWINTLRDCMSEFHSYGTTPGIAAENEREFYRLGTKIELLMNKNDPDFEVLQRAMYGYLGANDVKDKYQLNGEYVEICQRILKREWEVLKRELERNTAS